MRIVAISDTHSRHKNLKLPDGDVLIHAGDFSNMGYTSELNAFIDWFSRQPHPHKILICGNHEVYVETNPAYLEELCRARGITLLNNSGCEIDGVKFWGSPVTPEFNDWAFMRRRFTAIKQTWDLIPEGTNVLITHGPPHGILDELVYPNGDPKGEFAGCEELRLAVERIKPDIHIFGHIHCGHGEKHLNGTSFYNVAICDEMYGPTNPVTAIAYGGSHD